MAPFPIATGIQWEPVITMFLMPLHRGPVFKDVQLAVIGSAALFQFMLRHSDIPRPLFSPSNYNMVLVLDDPALIDLYCELLETGIFHAKRHYEKWESHQMDSHIPEIHITREYTYTIEGIARPVILTFVLVDDGLQYTDFMDILVHSLGMDISRLWFDVRPLLFHSSAPLEEAIRQRNVTIHDTLSFPNRVPQQGDIARVCSLLRRVHVYTKYGFRFSNSVSVQFGVSSPVGP